MRDTGFRVTAALPEDVPDIVEAVRCLLEELRGTAAVLPDGGSDVCRRVVLKDSSGAIFVARSLEENSLLGVVTVSVLEAIHHGGPYALIQDLWVRQDRRSDGIGTALVEAVEVYCHDHQLTTVEVCLPKYSFPNVLKTHRFYASCGFKEIGPRLRKEIP
jgi:branched-chain amino acid aminotransferase